MIVWDAYLISVSGILGLLIGSFLNVVVYRVPAGKSLLPGSRCPRCNEPIRPWHNVPVVGWIVLRGRCAMCNTSISPRYPLVEACTALVFVGVTWWWLSNAVSASLGAAASALMLVVFLYFAAVSIALALIDLDTFRLPNSIVFSSIGVIGGLTVTATLFSADPSALLRAVIGALLLMTFYGLLWFLWSGGMGLGDVKLAILLGLVLGWVGWGALIVGAFAAFVCGGAFGLALVMRGKAGRKTRIPFGPWMLLGAWIGIIAGEPIANWYLARFLGV